MVYNLMLESKWVLIYLSMWFTDCLTYEINMYLLNAYLIDYVWNNSLYNYSHDDGIVYNETS